MNWTNTQMILVAVIALLVGYAISYFEPLFTDDQKGIEISPTIISDSVLHEAWVDTGDVVITVFSRYDSVNVAGQWWYPGRDTVLQPFPKYYPDIEFIDLTDTTREKQLQRTVDSLQLAVATLTNFTLIKQQHSIVRDYSHFTIHTESFCGVHRAWLDGDINHLLWFEREYEPYIEQEYNRALQSELRRQRLENTIADAAAWGIAGHEIAEGRPVNAAAALGVRYVAWPGVKKVWRWIR